MTQKTRCLQSWTSKNQNTMIKKTQIGLLVFSFRASKPSVKDEASPFTHSSTKSKCKHWLCSSFVVSKEWKYTKDFLFYIAPNYRTHTLFQRKSMQTFTHMWKKKKAKISTDQCSSLLLLTGQKEGHPSLEAQMCLLILDPSAVIQGHDCLCVLSIQWSILRKQKQKATTTTKTNQLLSANLGNGSVQVIPFMGWFDSSRKWKQSTRRWNTNSWLGNWRRLLGEAAN